MKNMNDNAKETFFCKSKENNVLKRVYNWQSSTLILTYILPPNLYSMSFVKKIQITNRLCSTLREFCNFEFTKKRGNTILFIGSTKRCELTPLDLLFLNKKMEVGYIIFWILKHDCYQYNNYFGWTNTNQAS